MAAIRIMRDESDSASIVLRVEEDRPLFDVVLSCALAEALAALLRANAMDPGCSGSLDLPTVRRVSSPAAGNPPASPQTAPR